MASSGGFLGAARARQEKRCWFLTRTVGEQYLHPVCGVSVGTRSHLVNVATRKYPILHEVDLKLKVLLSASGCSGPGQNRKQFSREKTP